MAVPAAPIPAWNDEFGFSVAISGNTVVVVAHGNIASPADAGRGVCF